MKAWTTQYRLKQFVHYAVCCTRLQSLEVTCTDTQSFCSMIVSVLTQTLYPNITLRTFSLHLLHCCSLPLGGQHVMYHNRLSPDHRVTVTETGWTWGKFLFHIRCCHGGISKSKSGSFSQTISVFILWHIIQIFAWMARTREGREVLFSTCPRYIVSASSHVKWETGENKIMVFLK